MKLIFSIILICLCTSIYGQSKFFFHANGSLNMTYRDLSVSGKTSDVMKQFFKVRRNAEKIALREEFGLGVGVIINSNIQIQSGIFYKRFGDIEKDDLVTFIEGTGTYESREQKIIHSYYHVGIPIIFDYYFFDKSNWEFGLRIAPELDYLIGFKYKIRNDENIFGEPIGYPYNFTDSNKIVFGIKTGILGQYAFNSKTLVNVNVLFNYHLNNDFERELIVNQRNFSVGLNLSVSRLF